MDFQVVNTQHAVVAHGQGFNLLHQLGVRCFPQQRADGFADQADAGPHDEEGNKHSHIAIQPHLCKMSNQQAHQHRRSGDHVVAAVCAGGHERNGINAPAGRNIEACLPDFDGNGEHQHQNYGPAEVQRGRVEDFVHG